MAASRALALFAGAGGLWVLAAAVALPGFAGEGAMLGVSMAVGVALVAIAAAAWLRAARTPAWALVVVATPLGDRDRGAEPGHR